MDWTIKLTDVLMVVATLLSPFLAVQVSELLRASTAARDARQKVFHVLMSTRGARMSPEHVGALNRIDLVFPTQRFAKVGDTWSLYLRELSKDEPTTDALRQAAWAEQNRAFYALLRAMAEALNTPFSETTLQHNAYYPKGFVFKEEEAAEFRAAAVKVMRGEQALLIKAFPTTGESLHG